MALRVLIADDEQVARARLRRLLSEVDSVEIAAECKDGREVLERLTQNDIDLVFLDVQMPGLSGTEALARWPANGPRVVFCTAHTEHAIAAFDAGAVDYLLKPIEAPRLRKAVERAVDRGATERFHQELARHRPLGKLALTTRQGVVLVDFDEITHASLEGELVTVFASSGEHLTELSLQEISERLPQGLVERVHRRALLNLRQVARLEPLETGGYLAHTRGGHTVEISRQSARVLRKQLGLRKASDD